MLSVNLPQECPAASLLVRVYSSESITFLTANFTQRNLQAWSWGHELASLGYSEYWYYPEWNFISTGG